MIEGFIVENERLVACNGLGLTKLLHAGQQWLAAHVEVVNDLNVFPVPDGDTGTNMLLTMRAATAQVAETADHDVGTIAEAAAQGALMGARGNSGVILSQFLRGLATGLGGQRHFGAIDLATAMGLANKRAYESVVEPVEGTILTVARAVAEAAERSARQQQDLGVVWADMVAAAKAAQASTPDLLPLLKEAGVTDSGGQGLVYILEGAYRLLTNEATDSDSLAETDEATEPRVDWHAPLDVSGDYGYDVQFLLQGEGLDVAAIRAGIEALGESTLVVGDERLVKVHVHTPDPGEPISYGARLGIVSDVVVENLQMQAEAFARKHAPLVEAAIATIAVVSGEGLADIFRSLGVSRILAGGQTMNPSVQDIVAAIRRVESDSVMVLPNNSNIILAAEQAAQLVDKQVVVVPTKTIPQGIAALLSFNLHQDLSTNAVQMGQASHHVHSLEITEAVRDSTYNGLVIKKGDRLGLLNNDLVSVEQTDEDVFLALLATLDMAAYEIVTIYTGQSVSTTQGEALAQIARQVYNELEIEVHPGGQPQAKYIISVE